MAQVFPPTEDVWSCACFLRIKTGCSLSAACNQTVIAHFPLPAVYAPSLAQYSPTMDGCALRLASRLEQFAESGEIADMRREFGNMTLEMVGECAYG